MQLTTSTKKKKKMSMQSDIKTITEETTEEDPTATTGKKEEVPAPLTPIPTWEASKLPNTGETATEEETQTEEPEVASNKISNSQPQIIEHNNKIQNLKRGADTAKSQGTPLKTAGLCKPKIRQEE